MSMSAPIVPTTMGSSSSISSSSYKNASFPMPSSLFSFPTSIVGPPPSSTTTIQTNCFFIHSDVGIDTDADSMNVKCNSFEEDDEKKPS